MNVVCDLKGKSGRDMCCIIVNYNGKLQ